MSVIAHRPGRCAIVLLLLLGSAASLARAQPPPLDSTAAIERGIALHDAGRLDEAIAVYREVLAAEPQNTRALYQIGYASLARKDFPAAIGWFERGLAARPRNSNEFHHLLGISREYSGDLPGAEEAFRRAVAAAPERGPLHFSLGLNLAAQSRLEEATRALEANLRLRPGHGRGWLFLGEAVERQDLPLRAFAAYVRFLTLEPTGPFAARTVPRLSTMIGSSLPPRDQSVVIRPDRGPAGNERLDMVVVGALRRALGSMSDAAFLVPALERVLKVLTERHGQAAGDILVEARLLPYFEAARAEGHLRALAYDAQRAGGAAEVQAWLGQNAEAVESYRKWSSAWSAALPTSR